MKLRKNRFGFIDPKAIISGVVALMLLAIAIFTVFTITSETTTYLTDSFSNTETFQDDTLGSDPTDMYYTYTDTVWGTVANVSNLLTDYFWNVNQSDSSSSNYTTFAFKTNELGYYTRLSFKFTQDVYNERAYVYLDDSAGSAYGHFRVFNDSISFWTTTEQSNQTVDITDEHTVDVYLNLTGASTETVSTIRVVLSNVSGSVNDTGYYAPATTVRPGGLKITGASTHNISIQTDDIYLSGTRMEYTPTDVGTTADSVVGILGLVILMSALLMLVGLMYAKMRQ